METVALGGMAGACGSSEDAVELGADREASAAHGFTPLLIAAHQGHAEVVTTLAKLGADIDASTVTGDGALSLSRANDHHQTEWVLRA
jgi:ankyrin repeat protein